MACKDCGSTTRKLEQISKQVALCATCKRARRKARSAATHARHIKATFDLTPEEYDALLAEQGGRCAICRIATGKTKRLAVDHDHATGQVRGLLCSPCNRMLGHLRDSVRMALRIIRYLQYPPYQRMLVRRKHRVPTWVQTCADIDNGVDEC